MCVCVKTLRKTLDDRGMDHVRIVAADGGWGIANDVQKDPQLAASMDYIGSVVLISVSTYLLDWCFMSYLRVAVLNEGAQHSMR